MKTRITILKIYCPKGKSSLRMILLLRLIIRPWISKGVILEMQNGQKVPDQGDVVEVKLAYPKRV
jgi:hypothetical protein